MSLYACRAFKARSGKVILKDKASTDGHETNVLG